MADKGGYRVGDTLTLASLSPDGTTSDYPIVGIFEPPALLIQALAGEGTAPSQDPALPEDFAGLFWRDLTTLDGATVDADPIPQMFFVTTNIKNATAKQIDALIDDINEEFVSKGVPTISFNFVELTDQISSGFFTFQAILSAVAGLIALVGALGLLTTLSMSVYERQKEIGVMRSIGASSSVVATQFLTEGIVVGVISWLVGLPLMVLIQWTLLEVTNFSDTFPLELSPEAAIIGLVGMLVITTFASLWPSLSAARKTVSDILRYQ
jgi:ABC-type antimicrobial peptide transport system permease subunit